MDVMEAIRARRSVRSYEARPVDEAKLTAVLEAGRLAPSAKNLQEWRFVVVRDAATRQELMAAAKGQSFVGEAPVVIACCAETDEHVMSCGQLCYPIDVAIAVDHMTLKAVEEGLGTCWVGAFYEDRAKAVLGIPDEIRVVALLALGYPKYGEPARAKGRLTLDEIVHWERWGNAREQG
ncbi:MAG: nitroreductase family protein [Verrucomicrobia bacterium]|nr:nitroreductase family protein [Verrucomicrobiota bacterium]